MPRRSRTGRSRRVALPVAARCGGGFVNVGADQSSYTLGDADVGATIRVIVSYTDLNGAPEQVIAAAGPVANVNDAPVITAMRRQQCRDHDP